MVLYLALYLGHNRHSIKCEITERNIPVDCGQIHNGKWYALQRG